MPYFFVVSERGCYGVKRRRKCPSATACFQAFAKGFVSRCKRNPLGWRKDSFWRAKGVLLQQAIFSAVPWSYDNAVSDAVVLGFCFSMSGGLGMRWLQRSISLWLRGGNGFVGWRCVGFGRTIPCHGVVALGQIGEIAFVNLWRVCVEDVVGKKNIGDMVFADIRLHVSREVTVVDDVDFFERIEQVSGYGVSKTVLQYE